MEVVGSMLCLFVFVVLITTTSSIAATHARNQNFYRELAQTFHGTYLPGGLWSAPAIRFQYGGSRAVVQIHKGRRRGKRIVFRLERVEPGPCCVILARGSDSGDSYAASIRRFGEWSGAPPEIANRFRIFAADGDPMHRLMNDGFQWVLERLRRSADQHNLTVELAPHLFVVEKQLDHIRIANLEDVIRCSLAFCDQALLACAHGIDFTQEDVGQVVSDAMCPVCREALTGEMVVCRRCRTPHHRDCWLYFGACSTYGCQETQFIAPLRAAPTSTNLNSPAQTPPPSNAPPGSSRE